MDSFEALQKTISAALVSTTRSAAQLSSADIPFQRSLNPALGTALDSQNVRLLKIAQRLLDNAAASSDTARPRLPDVEAVDGNWKDIVDVIDSLLEKADASLDEYTGVVKRLGPGADLAALNSKPRFPTAPTHIAKPQSLFEHVPRNNETGGFRPLITSKPHAQVPLTESLATFKVKDYDGHEQEQYPHPYQTEIESYQYPESLYQEVEPIPYTPFETTTATFVDTPEDLAMMLAELKTAKEIAIDLEHHDNRSYIGLVSLMQISTRNKDWIVDTLKPWRRRLECLNEVFADPSILKVLHGAFMDIIWLQRDLGLYIVGLFDTYHACRALVYQGASLAFLLDKFIGFKAQKQYQLADWRVRPLTEDLFTYARADTHFLLYIFDNMRNELVRNSDFSDPDKDKISDVLNKSKETALQRYQHPIYDSKLGQGPMGWARLLTNISMNFTDEEFAVFKAVHKWRDDLARKEDESPIFIMPNHALFSIARDMPADKAALFRITQHVSPLLRAFADEVVEVVAKAKQIGTGELGVQETMNQLTDLRLTSKGHFKSNKTAAPKRKSAPATAPSTDVQAVAPSIAFDPHQQRAILSQFWGNLLSNGVGEQRPYLSTLSVDLAVPLPPLTAEIIADTDGMLSGVDNNAVRPQHTFVPADDRPAEDRRTDIFIVKQLGGKRKRSQEGAMNEQSDKPDAADAQDVDMGDADVNEIVLDETLPPSSKRDKHQKKKDAKARKKERNRQKADSALDYGDEEPVFDYANAPSVLHAHTPEKSKSGSGKRKKEKKKRDQGFNPYAQMTNAPKGLPKSQKESAGRSKTFSS